MPRITRVFIKTGLIYFLGALLTGIALEIEYFSVPALLPLFWHMLMVGWITQIIFGVSIWMYPGRTREEGFLHQKWGWLTYLFLNTGLLLRIIAEPLLNYSDHHGWGVTALLSAVLQLAAAVTYVIEMWPRIQSKKERLKKRREKRRKSKNSTG